MIEWFARNPVAANLLMVAVVIAGFVSASRSIPIEAFPSFEPDRITVTTAFRGATPRSVEDSITSRIEEAIYDLEGIEKIESRSSEGSSVVIADVVPGYEKRQVLNDIKLRVDALSTLPQAAEKPVVAIAQLNFGVIFLAVLGDDNANIGPKLLRTTADKVREDLLLSPEISLIEYDSVADYEISIEVDQQTLDAYNLSIDEIGQRIREGAVDISAGNIQSRAGDILVRTDGQAYTESDFAKLPIISNGSGVPVRLGQIATINDGFEEQPLITKFNGKPAIMLEVLRVGDQSAIQVANEVHKFIAKSKQTLPPGISLEFWDDDSVVVRNRISTLVDSGIQGGILAVSYTHLTLPTIYSV